MVTRGPESLRYHVIRLSLTLLFFMGFEGLVLGAEWPDLRGSLRDPADLATTPGTIITARVLVKRANADCCWTPIIVYAYTVNGHRLQASNLTFRKDSFSEGTAQRYLARYPVGKTVPVFDDPLQPTVVALEPHIRGPWTGPVPFAAGVGLLLLGSMGGSLWGIYAAQRARRAARAMRPHAAG